MAYYTPQRDETTRLANGDIRAAGDYSVFVETATPSNLRLERAGVWNESANVIPLQSDAIVSRSEGALSRVEVTESTPYGTVTKTIIVVDQGGVLVPLEETPVAVPQTAAVETDDYYITTDAAEAAENETYNTIYEPPPAEIVPVMEVEYVPPVEEPPPPVYEDATGGSIWSNGWTELHR
jgi:hypothetical protein